MEIIASVMHRDIAMLCSKPRPAWTFIFTIVMVITIVIITSVIISLHTTATSPLNVLSLHCKALIYARLRLSDWRK